MNRRLTPQTTLDHLKKEVKRWKKALDSGDPDARARLDRSYPQAPAEPTLRHVQHALACEYGFTAWIELRNAVAPGAVSDEVVQQFLESACPDHRVRGRPAHVIARGTAMRLLQRLPAIAQANFFTAVVCGDIDRVKEMLDDAPELANAKSRQNREPLLYLCFTRLPLAVANDNAVAIAKLLLDHGADPNVFFMAGDSPYTPLVGAIGEGEEDRPAHPHRDELARLLLEHGANFYDLQVIYNIHFHGKILWFLKLMYEFALKAGRENDWKDPEWHFSDMGGYGTGARWHLCVAIEHNDLELAEWCLTHGASPNAEPPRAKTLPQVSLYEFALRRGSIAMAELLARYGAERVELSPDDEDSLVAAALRMDRKLAEAIVARHPKFLQSPKALFAAARADRADAVAMLLDLGVPIEVEDQSKQRALHVAAWADAPDVARLLIERGAEIDPVESNWSNTPLYNALWGEVTRMIELLSPLSRDIWALTFLGHIDRLRKVFAEEPERAKTTGDWMPLFRLPDDERKAAEIVDLYVSLGADVTFKRGDGLTAAEIARRRGLVEAAAKLEAAARVQQQEKLADDLIVAFDTGDADALARLNQQYGLTMTVEDLRAQMWRRVYAVRHAGGGRGALSREEARLVIARNAGFANWDLFVHTVAVGTVTNMQPYSITRKDNRIGPRKLLTDSEWDDLIGVMKEHRITRLDARGFATDKALARIAELDFLTDLNLGGSREVSDDGLLLLARLPQLRSLNLSEYPGGKLTDRGLEVLRHLPELRKFEMAWQKGVSDAGVSNLKYCEKLEQVHLLGSPTGDGVVDALRGKPNLWRFDTGRLVTDRGLAILHDFPLFKAWNGKTGDEGSRILIDGPFTNQGLAGLATLDGVTGVHLFWHVSEVTSDAFDVFTRMANLEFVGADGKLSDDRAMAQYAAIPKLRRLQSQGAAATDDGYVALSKSPTLEKYWGREAPHLTGRGFIALSKMPALREMGVSLAQVDDASLASLADFPALRVLTPIDVLDEGFRHVGKCEQLENLLCMYCRETTDVATEHIRNLRIKSYYAGKTKITDRSLEILGGVETLERIEFWECAGITDAGLPFLARLPNLREIEFGAVPGVTLDGIAVFPARVLVDYWT